MPGGYSTAAPPVTTPAPFSPSASTGAAVSNVLMGLDFACPAPTPAAAPAPVFAPAPAPAATPAPGVDIMSFMSPGPAAPPAAVPAAGPAPTPPSPARSPAKDLAAQSCGGAVREAAPAPTSDANLLDL